MIFKEPCYGELFEKMAIAFVVYIFEIILLHHHRHPDNNKSTIVMVKNSWNEMWGEEGYFRILRGTDDSGIEYTVYGVQFSGVKE